GIRAATSEGHATDVFCVRAPARINRRLAVSETNLAVRIPPSNLVLAGTLQEEPCLQCVVTEDFGDVVVDVDRSVGLKPWIRAQVRPWVVNSFVPAESKVGNVGLICDRE